MSELPGCSLAECRTACPAAGGGRGRGRFLGRRGAPAGRARVPKDTRASTSDSPRLFEWSAPHGHAASSAAPPQHLTKAASSRRLPNEPGPQTTFRGAPHRQNIKNDAPSPVPNTNPQSPISRPHRAHRVDRIEASPRSSPARAAAGRARCPPTADDRVADREEHRERQQQRRLADRLAAVDAVVDVARSRTARTLNTGGQSFAVGIL